MGLRIKKSPLGGLWSRNSVAGWQRIQLLLRVFTSSHLWGHYRPFWICPESRGKTHPQHPVRGIMGEIVVGEYDLEYF